LLGTFWGWLIGPHGHPNLWGGTGWLLDFGTWNSPNFIMLVQIFWGLPKKNFSSQKHAKLGMISDNFKL